MEIFLFHVQLYSRVYFLRGFVVNCPKHSLCNNNYELQEACKQVSMQARKGLRTPSTGHVQFDL